MILSVKITGIIDVPDEWGEDAQDVADYRYNDQLTLEDALDELIEKLKVHPEDVEVGVCEYGGRTVTPRKEPCISTGNPLQKLRKSKFRWK